MKIEIELKNEEQALNEFNKKEINENLNQYLKKSLEHKPLKEVTLIIKGTKKKELEKIIKEYYQKKYFFMKNMDNLDNYIRLALLIIGAIFLLISEQLKNVLSEFFLIAGWVIIWEIIYDCLFNEIKRKRKCKILKALANCEIKFIDK